MISCSSNCRGCDPHAGPAVALRVTAGRYDHTVALAGNPNTGKSTVFNRLTGLKQHTGNWPGKTVTRAEGGFAHRGKRFKLVDLPGTYSLLAGSDDEQVARDYLLFSQPDCTVVVVDATSLERNLNLVFQITEITPRAVVCVNLVDEAKRKGIHVDVNRLSDQLGVPAVATAARRGEGLDQLASLISGVATGEIAPEPRLHETPAPLRDAVNRVLPMVRKLAPGLPSARWVAYRLLEGDEQIRSALATGELARIAEAFAPRPQAAPAPAPAPAIAGGGLP